MRRSSAATQLLMIITLDRSFGVDVWPTLLACGSIVGITSWCRTEINGIRAHVVCVCCCCCVAVLSSVLHSFIIVLQCTDCLFCWLVTWWKGWISAFYQLLYMYLSGGVFNIDGATGGITHIGVRRPRQEGFPPVKEFRKLCRDFELNHLSDELCNITHHLC